LEISFVAESFQLATLTTPAEVVVPITPPFGAKFRLIVSALAILAASKIPIVNKQASCFDALIVALLKKM
jgi:hypothetical protein